jgi:hypothetical protein
VHDALAVQIRHSLQHLPDEVGRLWLTEGATFRDTACMHSAQQTLSFRAHTLVALLLRLAGRQTAAFG